MTRPAAALLALLVSAVGWSLGSAAPALADSELRDAYVPAPRTSADFRDVQTVQVLAGSRGYSLGLLLGKDRILEAGYSGLYHYGSAYEDTDVETPSRWRHEAFLRLMRFHGNSFYSYGGASLAGRGDDEDRLEDPDRTTAFLLLGLGNQWHWRHVTLGCDWIGLKVPFYSRVRHADADEDRRTVSVTPNDFDSWEIEALKFYVGVAI